MNTYKPSGHSAVSPYLLIADVSRMLEFLQATFAAEVLEIKKRPDGSIQHAEVKIDDSVMMMGERPERQNSICCSTHVYVADVDQCYQRALQAGASSISEPEDQVYGDRTAGVKDIEGNIWWLSTRLSPEQ